MRELTAAVLAFLTLASQAYATPILSAEEAQAMQMEALADRAPDRVHGRFDFILADPDSAVDATTGSGVSPDNQCAKVMLRTQRTDGTSGTTHINVCD